ncbi:hypothetical protein WJX72_006429 [[Myrmecia] bisecta]|uniref:tRNA-binding domain-containing protein n=1 Tax=[Myrmecia] bisecta TaxID=41462 RepID=A0AAW1PK79_9CHLO
MTKKAQLRLPAGDAARAPQLVAAYAGVSDLLDVSTSESLQLTTTDGQQLSGHNTICRYIASLSPRRTQLLGDTPETQALIAQWLSYRNTDMLPLTDEQLLHVNSALLLRTYLVGSTVSVADLVLFASLHRAMVNLPLAQTERYCNLFRWFDFLQHTVDSTGIFPRLQFPKPKFRPAPPAPAPAPKAEKGKAAAAGSETSKPAPAPSKAAAPSSKPCAASTAPPMAGAPGSKAAAAPGSKAAAAAGAKALGGAAPANGPASGQHPAASTSQPAEGAPEGKAKKEKKEKKEKPAAAKKEDAEPTVDMLDIRVGQIVKVEQHPNADALYVEDIDLGEDKPRQVVSGLVKFVPKEQMQNRRVVVVTNLKPAKMRDVMSYGMVLCASNAAHDKVDPIIPPEGVPLGEKIVFSGFEGEPEAVLNPKKKIFEKIAPDLATDAIGVANYKGVPFMTSNGPVTSSIPNASVK